MMLDDSEGLESSSEEMAPGHDRAPGGNPMSAFRAAMTTVSTTWGATDHAKVARAFKITVSILATTAVVALASFVAVALSLT
jgi:hypothetical protein